MKTFKKALACFLVVAMFLTAAPLSGFVGLQWPDLNLPKINFGNIFNKNAAAAEITDSGTCGANLTWTLDDAGTLTISGTGEMENYDPWDNYSPWYSNRTSVKKIVIENGVTSIGSYAFYYCTSLTSVTIGNSVTSIGKLAFCNCTSLTDITVDADNTAYCSEDGVLFNKSKTELIQYLVGNARTSYTIPDSVTSIGEYTFWYCTSLTSVTIPDSVTSIGDWAFYDCTSLTAVHISDIAAWCNIDFDGYYANPLRYAHNLYLNGTLVTTLTIPDNVTSIGNYAFHDCTSLTSVTIPDRVTSIGNWAFAYCTSLPSVTIPDSVTSIGDDAFYYCTKLTSITIPDSVTSIGEWAFYSCTSLPSVTIPDSVTSIGRSAFSGCKSLTDITVDADNTAYCSEDGALFNKSKTELIQYPVGNARTSYTIPDSVTSFGDYAFACCTSLTSVTIPDRVTSIGWNAFHKCTSLTSVTILNPACEIYDTSETIDDGAVIYGYTNSTAQAYAEKYNRTFVALDPHTHSYTSIVTLPATCCTTGVKTYTCECEDSYTEEIAFDFTNHVGGTEIRNAIAPTCTADGYTGDTYCLGCNNIIDDGEVLPALGHDFITIVRPTVMPNPNCAEPLVEAYCSRCGYEKIKPPRDHEWDEGVLDPEPTPEQDGILTYTCNLCWETKTETVKYEPEIIASGTCGENLTWTLDDAGTLTISGTGAMGNYSRYSAPWNSCRLSIKRVIIEKGVTTIGNYAFGHCASLLSIDIPDSVTSIGHHAFCFNNSLISITIPANVTVIGSNAFRHCISLTSITIPDNVTNIDSAAFYECTSLTEVILSKNSKLTVLGNSAFYLCNSLTSISIPDGIKSINSSVFYACGLTEVNFSSNSQLTSIFSMAFGHCQSLKSISIPAGVEKISYDAFYHCTSLSVITVDADNTHFISDDNVLYNIEKTQLVHYPSSDTRKSFIIPDGVKTIDSYAFHNCQFLIQLTVPDCVERINANAIDCYILKNIFVYSKDCYIADNHYTMPVNAVYHGYDNSSVQSYAKKYEHTFVSIDGASDDIAFSGSCGENAEFAITFGGKLSITGNGAMEDYVSESAAPWYKYRYLIKTVNIADDITSIGNYSLCNLPNVTTITIPAGVTNIGYAAFRSCSSLTAFIVDVGNEYYSSDENGILFNKNKTILIQYPAGNERTSYTIPSGVTTIGLFYDCTFLTAITIPDSVISIGDYAFSGCTSLTAITIPDSVTEFGNYAFYYCTSLTEVTLPKNMKYIGKYTFYKCTSLTEITIPDSVTSIGHCAFTYCESLTTVNIPNSVTSISEYAFESCSALTTVNINNDSKLQNIGISAFNQCVALTSIFIPDKVRTIKSSAFAGCTSMTEIAVHENNNTFESVDGVLYDNDVSSLICYPAGKTDATFSIPKSVTDIENKSFAHCSALTTLIIPDTVTFIGQWAFAYCSVLQTVTFEGNSRLTNIPYCAFHDCESLTNIAIPDSVTVINSSAFFDCPKLLSVTFGENSKLESIESSSFHDCYTFPTITIPRNVTKIDTLAFYYCVSLASITILNPDCEIYDSANTIDAGATIYGYTNSTAQAYAEKYNRTFVALDPHEHSYTSTVTLAATCCTTGVKTYTCECEDSYIEVIPFDFTNHVGETEVRNAVKFNCITGGYTGDTYCLGCNNKIADGIRTPGTGEHTYEYKTMTEIIEIKGNNKIDLVFVVDTTGSMSGYIAAMQNGMKGYLNQLEAKDIDYRIAIVDYRDFANRGSSDSYDYPYKVQLAFTGNEDAVISAINGLSLGNGGDTDETVYSALIDGLNELSWREDAGKTVILMGDANALDPEPNTGYTLADAVESLQKDYSSPVTLFAISATGSTISTFASLATQTGGKCYTSAASLDVSEFVSDIIEVIEKTVIIPDSEWVKTKEPTCTEPGVESRTCTVCDDVQTRTIPAPGHDFVFTTEEDATCTESGYVLYTCSRCGLEKRETIQPYGHDFGSDNICDRCGFELPPDHEHSYTTTIVPPTCTEMGYTEYACDCGYSYRADIIEQLGHSWDKGVVTLAKTCTTDGKLTKTCTVCSATRVDPIPASHEWSETIIKAATCTEDGEKKCVCTVCGETKTEIIPAAHTWGVVTVTKAPTCTEKGKETRICSVCGTEQEFDIPALGHNFVDGICTRCGIGFIDVITKDYANPEYGMYFAIDEIVSDYGPSLVDEYGLLLDYNEGAKFNKVAIYLTQDGTMWRRCIACTGSNITRATYVPYLAYNSEVLYSGLNSAYINTFRLSKNASGIWEYSNYATIGVNLQDAYGNLLLSLYDIGQAGAKTRIFDDLDEMKAWLQEDCENHTEEVLPGVEPTCTTAGKTEGKWCPNCGQIIVKQELVPALAHAWDEGVLDPEPTPEQDGIITYTCTRCGKTKTVKYEVEIIASGTCGENLTWTLYADGTLVISGTGDMTNYSSSSSVPWYSYRESIKTVVIADGVTSIGNHAFRYCDSLENVTFGENSQLTTIGSYAFYNCDSLESVTFGENSKLTSIGYDAFAGCDSLASITIPDSVKSIGYCALYDCDSLTSITVDADNANYSSDEYGVLFNKDKTTLIQYPIGNTRTSYTIPDSVTSIGNHAFYDCTSLASVDFGDNSQLTSIGNFAFAYCDSLASITIPDRVTSISDDAFYNCTSLASITIPDSVMSIGDWAFYSCTSLPSVTIPDSVTSIGWSAFSGCKSLTDITVDADNTAYCSEDGVLFNKSKTELIQYPIGNARTSYTIPDSVTSIGDYAFAYCTSLPSVTIPDRVTSIGWNAFYECTSLTSVTILNPACEIYDTSGTIDDGAVIYGYTNSTAQAYAEKYNRTFVALDAHEHSYTSEVTLAATCCTTGLKTYTCECEDSYKEVIPFDFTNHVGETEVRDAVPATCTDGYTGDTYCLGCNTKIADGETIPGTGAHTPDSYTEPASCTVNGYTMTFCTECGEELEFETIPATHKWDDGIITTAATCVEEGVITYTCTVCEDTKTESTPIEPEQHTGETELRNAVPATPEHPGYSGDLYCQSCGNLLEAGVTVNLGDVDFDGKITPEDARLALREVRGYKELTYAQIAAADCDRNGAIQAADMRIIMRASVGLELLWSYASIDFELLPLDPDNNSSVSVETNWTPDHFNKIALHIYLDECVDLTSCHLQLSYDSDSFTHSDFYRYAGMDAEETQNATTNNFNWEIGRGNDGVLLLGGYFKESLWDAETFLASSKDPNDPCIVNDKKFHAFTILLDVTDKSYLCNGTTVFVEGNLTFEQEDGTIVAIGVKNSVTHDGLDGQHYGGFGECITGTKTCSICGTKYNLYAEYHEWNEWIVVTEATFEAEGLQERTCSVCSAKETEIIPILETKTYEDDNSGISVETDKDAYGGKDVEVKVEEVFDGSHYLGQSFGKHETWNIKTYVDGEQVQPETPVYVRIPLPEGFDPNKTFVYHINSQTGEREKMDVQVIDGYICFYTSSFSLYIVVDESTLIENPTELIIYKPYTIAKETADGFAVVSVNTTVADILAACNATTVLTATGEKADATEKLATGMQLVLLDGESVVDSIKIVVLGDIDGDGNVSSADARLALRASVKLETLNAEETLAADVEHDNTIAASDARIILRGSVNLDDPASWLMNF